MRLEDSKEIDLLFADETGFNLTPYIPYGWHRSRVVFRPSSERPDLLVNF